MYCQSAKITVTAVTDAPHRLLAVIFYTLPGGLHYKKKGVGRADLYVRATCRLDAQKARWGYGRVFPLEKAKGNRACQSVERPDAA